MSTQPDSSKEDLDNSDIVRFLSFLGKDIAAHPERLKVFDEEFFRKSEELTQGIDISGFNWDHPHIIYTYNKNDKLLMPVDWRDEDDDEDE